MEINNKRMETNNCKQTYSSVFDSPGGSPFEFATSNLQSKAPNKENYPNYKKSGILYVL